MLIGQYTSKLTDKDRLSIPKKFREELGDELIVAKWYEDGLVLVSKDAWGELRSRLTGKPGLIVSPVREIDRFILGSAFEIKLDVQGRFVLPESLMNFAGIKEEVVFVGLGDRVEIWEKQRWDAMEDKAQEKAHKAIEKLARKEKKP